MGNMLKIKWKQALLINVTTYYCFIIWMNDLYRTSCDDKYVSWDDNYVLKVNKHRVMPSSCDRHFSRADTLRANLIRSNQILSKTAIIISSSAIRLLIVDCSWLTCPDGVRQLEYFITAYSRSILKKKYSTVTTPWNDWWSEHEKSCHFNWN